MIAHCAWEQSIEKRHSNIHDDETIILFNKLVYFWHNINKNKSSHWKISSVLGYWKEEKKKTSLRLVEQANDKNSYFFFICVNTSLKPTWNEQLIDIRSNVIIDFRPPVFWSSGFKWEVKRDSVVSCNVSCI